MEGRFAVGGDNSRISDAIYALFRVHTERSNYNGDGEGS